MKLRMLILQEFQIATLRIILQENKKKLVPVSEISSSYGIPKEVLAKTLQKLASSDIIKSYKGPNGGYKASKKIESTTLNDFFEILEGPTAIMDCYFEAGCDHLNSCNIRTPINKINDSIRNLFDNLTLSDISQ